MSAEARRRLRTARIEQVVDHAPGTRSLWLRPTDGAPVRSTPGQFISCELPTAGPRALPRAYSIAASEEDGKRIEICLDRIEGGPGSNYLFSLSVGATLEFLGPLGFFTLASSPERDSVFVAAATTVAPIRPMIHHAIEAGGESSLVLLHAAVDAAHLLYRDEFTRLSEGSRRFQYHTLVPGSSAELLGAVEERFVGGDTRRDREIFVCAVGDLALHLRDLLRGAGYARASVHYERW